MMNNDDKALVIMTNGDTYYTTREQGYELLGAALNDTKPFFGFRETRMGKALHVNLAEVSSVVMEPQDEGR